MKNGISIEHKSPQFICGSGLRAVRDQPGAGEKRTAGGESGLLSHLLHPFHLSAVEGGADRSGLPSSLTPSPEHPARAEEPRWITCYCEVNENIKAYGVASHRHTPEIEEQLSYAAGKPVLINFTPHLVPMNRGILITAYASLTGDVFL